jgi:polyisoprenoid-binding protein YceI
MIVAAIIRAASTNPERAARTERKKQTMTETTTRPADVRDFDGATIPAPGTFDLDPAHTRIGFSARHMMVSKVRGRFDKFEGTIITAPDPLQSSVTATIDLSSVNTGEPNRDNHIRSADFFEVESHPTLTFRSTGVSQDGDDFLLDGDLTIRGTTKPVTLKLEVNGFGPDPFGGTRVGFSATGEINRNDFGVSYNGPIPGGGVMVSEKVSITLEIEGVLQKGEGE